MNKCDSITREILIKNGFTYRKKGWYRCTEDFLQIINFQKSSWSNQYYINLGLNFISSGDDGKVNYPPERLFPFRGRVEDIENRNDLLECLDFEKAMSEEERSRKMLLITENCITFLDRIQTKEGLKYEYHTHNFDRFAIYQSFLSFVRE